MHPILGSFKWTALDLVFLSIFILIKSSDAHILVYRLPTNQLIEEYNDLPAQFGPALPSNGLKAFPIPASHDEACTKIDPPPKSSGTAKFVAIIKRGGTNCTFERKIRMAQNANFNAVIIYNNASDDLEQMSAKDPSGIYIPSVFVGHTTGISLLTMYPYDIILVINDEMPFNINTQLILPFSVLIGLCFISMIIYMIYKCVREERRLRRYRLPKSMLKKLPITKFTKANELSYDTCVICLEEFIEGDKIRILPCKHPYHSQCIDPWLTENRRVCPICKRKVFTKGEIRTNRNRQPSLDSVTDTDDDTTPLLRQIRGTREGLGASTQANAIATTATATTTTRHGTFRRRSEVAAEAHSNIASDDENVLSPRNNAGRVNPFNGSQNSPQNTESNAMRLWFSIQRLFRRRTPISIAAPPFLEEVYHDALAPIDATINAVAAAASTSAITIPTSNNILNPNLCGSLMDDNDDDELPRHSIYEPALDDSAFVQTPTRGGIGVPALPNPTNDATMGYTHGAAAARGQFLI